MDGGGKEIRLAADQSRRWHGTYLTVGAARRLAKVLVKAAEMCAGAKRKRR